MFQGCLGLRSPTGTNTTTDWPSHQTSGLRVVDDLHFKVTDEDELVYLLTDGDDSWLPSGRYILEPDEESPLRNNYDLCIPLEHPDSHRRRTPRFQSNLNCAAPQYVCLHTRIQ